MRRISLLTAMFLVTLALMPVPAYADTGTYEILDYAVELTPLDDGGVHMTYYQKWLCTGGHIPWVTVGTANSNYNIIATGGNVGSARDDSSGVWQGAYLTLDKDYTSGEQFTVSFSIVQRDLLERLTDEGKWRIDFTPGWYDNCVTHNLTIALNSPVPVSSYAFAPEPAQVIDDTTGHILCSFSSLNKEFKTEMKKGNNREAAKLVGEFIAEKAKAIGIEKVSFDRAGYQYHGRHQFGEEPESDPSNNRTRKSGHCKPQYVG